MKRKLLWAACAFLLTVPPAHAQWVVTDPGNLAQGIVNSVNEMVETSETAQNALSTFKEASKIYEQSRKYYDMLKSVNSLVSGSLKVKESVLMLSEISESYVMNYGKMLTDENYTQRELEAIAFGYNDIMKKSSASVAELKNIINPTGMSMTDQGTAGPHRKGVPGDEALQDAGELLHPQEPAHLLPAGQGEGRDRTGPGTLRGERTLLVNP